MFIVLIPPFFTDYRGRFIHQDSVLLRKSWDMNPFFVAEKEVN